MMSPPGFRATRTLAPLCLFAGFCVFWFSDTVADPDLWGHVRFGQDIRRTGSIVRVDPYSYRTSGQVWINHEWVAEVVFAGVYRDAGPRGLIVFKLLIALVIVGFCLDHLGRRGLGPFWSLALLVLISIPFRLGLATIRPQIFTYLLFLLELLLLERASTGTGRGLWALPLLFVAWVNLHGGVLAGIGVLGLWIAARVGGRLAADRVAPVRGLVSATPLVLLGIACGLALLGNPYGYALVTFLLRTATVPRPEISEWTPLGLMSFPGQLYLLLVAIEIFSLVGTRRRRRPETVVVLGVTTVLPLLSNRHYPLFALALVVLAGEHLADALARWSPASRPPIAPRRRVAVTCLIAGVALVVLSIPRFGCIRFEPFYFPFPARGVELLRRSGIGGNLAVPYDWGEYAIWHLGPAVRVSMDGRRETVYSDESYRQSADLSRGTGVWNALLRTPPPTDLVLAPNGSPTANLLSLAAGWRPLYQDTCCAIFARKDLPGLDRLVRTPVPALPDDGQGLCFPGPSRSRSAAEPRR